MRNLLLWMSAVVFSGCATTMNGSNADVSILTEPAGADIYIDNHFIGKSPMSAKVEHANHNIRVEKPGYETGVAQITASISGWSAVGAMLIVPVIVDASTGALTSVDQKEIRVNLRPLVAPVVPVVLPSRGPER